MDFNEFVMREQYKKVSKLGDRFVALNKVIDWSKFVPIVKSLFNNDTEKGGRPNTNELVVVKCLLLQGWYGLSDEELEYHVNDRLSFRNFLGYPESVPDFSTIWRMRTRLEQSGKDKIIWAELQRQLNEKGYVIKTGVIQDATFVEADPGKKRRAQEKHAEKKGEPIIYTKDQLTHIDRDGKYAIKNDQIHFGYKSHVKTDVDYKLVRSIEVTSANVHDSRIDLTEQNDVAMYRDRGYCGAQLRYACVNDFTMIRKDSKRDWVKAWNKYVASVRCVGELPFAVVKRMFHGTRTYVKTLARVRVKETFKYMAYNMLRLTSLVKLA